MSVQESDSFQESGIFNNSLSMWRGISHQNRDGSFSYEDEEDFEPILLDLHTAASIGEDDILKDILERNKNKVNAPNRGGWSPLMYAAYMGHENTMNLLLDCGADPNLRTRQGSTSLILAAMCGNYTVMPLLLQKGGDLEGKDSRGWTALFHAASSGHQQTTEFFINAGADCEVIEPTQGLTPLMEAAASGHEIIVHQLLQRGVDKSRVDNHGDSARTIAFEYGHMKVASLIDNYKPSRMSSCGKGLKSYHNMNSHQKAAPVSKGTNKYSSSGPSIHDGPRKFAEMTGLGAKGIPEPNEMMPLFLQQPSDQVIESVQPRQTESRWTGPKDLPTLLEEIGCSKHLHVFKEQDIDLRIFLTLTEAELKEIGIKLFGPRRRMIATIAEINNGIQASLIDRAELVYCDSLLMKLRDIEDKLKNRQDTISELTAQLAQERQLRSVAESVLMDQKESRSSVHRSMEKLTAEHSRLIRIADQLRSCSARANQSKARHQSTHNTTLPNNSKLIDQEVTKISQEFDTILHHIRDHLLEMQRFLQRSTSMGSIKSDPQWKDRGNYPITLP